MKAFIFSTNFLLTLFLTLPLAICSSDDDEGEGTFQPIEIMFSEDFFTSCNQTKTVGNVVLSFRGTSENENSCSQEIGSCFWNDNIFPNGFTSNNGSTDPALALFGGVFEIDLSDVNGASKATITIDDNCGVGCTQANLYEGDNVVANAGNTILGRDLEDLVLNLNENSSSIGIWSCEGAVVKILIE